MVAVDKSPRSGLARHTIPLGARSTRIDRTYGRFVQLLKITLPTVAVMLVALLVAWPYFSDEITETGMQLLDIDETSPDSMQLSNARYQGVDDQNQPYTITADKIRQEALDSDAVNLEGPKADIMLEDESWAAITAITGVYNRDTQILSLNGDVNFFHDLGYEIRTQSARLRLESGAASGDEPVEGQGPFGSFNAEGFEVIDRGSRVLLTGKSKLIIYPDAAE